MESQTHEAAVRALLQETVARIVAQYEALARQHGVKSTREWRSART